MAGRRLPAIFGPADEEHGADVADGNRTFVELVRLVGGERRSS